MTMTDLRRRLLIALGELHDQWVAANLESAGRSFDATGRKEGSDYNQHHVDLDADPGAQDEFSAQALALVTGRGRARSHLRHQPGKHNQDSHGNDVGVDVVPGDKLRLAGRIKLGPGERLLGSDRVSGHDGRAYAAATERDGRRHVRLGLGNGVFGSRHDDSGVWNANPDQTNEINKKRKALREEQERLEEDLEDLEDDPNADPADIEDLRKRLDQLENADTGDVDPNGYTAELDENSARQLRETLTKALADGEKIQAELDEPYQEIDRLERQRDKLRNMGRKWTDEEDAEWDRLTAEIERLVAELDPLSGPERPESGFWTLAEGSIPGQWANVHYDVFLDDPDVGVEVKLGAVPHGSEMDFDDLRGNELAASLGVAQAQKLVRLLAKLSGDQPDSRSTTGRSRGVDARHTPGGHPHNQLAHAGPDLPDLVDALEDLIIYDADDYWHDFGDELYSEATSSGLTPRIFENGGAHLALDLPDNNFQVLANLEDSEGMEGLSGTIRDVLDLDLDSYGDEDEDEDGLIYRATDSLSDVELGRYPSGDVYIRTGEGGRMDISQEEAEDLADKLDSVGEVWDREFEYTEEANPK